MARLLSASVPWSLSAPASAPPQSSLCCRRWPPSNLGERFGGFMEPATAASIHLRRRCVISSRPCPEAAVTFVTAHQSQPTGDCRFRQGGARRRARVRGNGRPARCGPLHLRSSRVYERSRRRPCRLGNRPRAPAHREFRVGPVEDAGDRCGPAASAASAGGSRGGRARWYPLRAAISLSTGVPPSAACSNSPRRAMCRCAGRAAPEFVITARRG